MFKDRHGDWGRDMVLRLARRRSGLTLRELGEHVGGMGSRGVFSALDRFNARLERDRTLMVIEKELLIELQKRET